MGDGDAPLQDAGRSTLVQLGVDYGERFGHTSDASSFRPIRGKLPSIYPSEVFGPLLMVKMRQPSHEFTFGVGISFIPYPLVLIPVV
jgi:hypothetical protein